MRSAKESNTSPSWKSTLKNQRLLSTALAVFLFIASLFLLTRMQALFRPVQLALKIIAPPILVATLFFYLLNPLVEKLVRRKVPRNLAIAIVFIGIIALFGGFIYFLMPVVRTQFDTLTKNTPKYVQLVLSKLEALVSDRSLAAAFQYLQDMDIMTHITEQGQNIIDATLGSISNVISMTTTVTITLLTAPFVLYYMFVDGHHFKEFIVQAFPTKMQPGVNRFLVESHQQVGSYIRGQMLVAICVAIMFFIGYSLIGLDYALLLAINSGILNMVPYLGSILSALPALILGLLVSPMMAVKVVLILFIEQTIEGRFISPVILGNSLEIHPLVILFVLLVSGGLFGVIGVLLAVPGYAILKILITMGFEWLHEHTDLYQ